jgi:hypothetical protein
MSAAAHGGISSKPARHGHSAAPCFAGGERLSFVASLQAHDEGPPTVTQQLRAPG